MRSSCPQLKTEACITVRAVSSCVYNATDNVRHTNRSICSTPVATTAGTLTVDGEVDLTGTDDEGDTQLTVC